MKYEIRSFLKQWVAVVLLMGSPLFAATLDWDGWTAEDLSRSYTNIDGTHIDADVSITGNTNDFENNEPDDINDSVGTALDLDVNFDRGNREVVTTIHFSVPVRITNLRIRDIDYDNTNGFFWASKFDDRIIIAASDEEGNVYAPDQELLGDNITNNGNGDYESDNTGPLDDDDSKGYVTVQYNNVYITELNITYTKGDDSPDNPTEQHVLLDNIDFEAKDTDGDGVADFWDIDDDNDGILDSVEIQGAGNCAYGFFHMIGGVLNIFDEENKVYVPIGEKHTSINAMGYDEQTGKLYASIRANSTDDYGNTLSKNDVIEIDRYSGKIKKAENTSSVNSYSADFYQGKLYFRNGNDAGKVYTWERDNGTVTKVVNSKLKSADFSILVDGNNNPIGYGLKTVDTESGKTDNTELYTVDIDGHTIGTSNLTVTTPDDGDLNKGWGATFTANNSILYAANNNGYIYQIDYTASPPTATFVYRSVKTSNNDGASCRDANQYAVDSDGDGIKDYLDLDSDNDGIPDNVEAQPTDSYDPPSSAWTDSDGDGLADQYDDDTSGKAGSNGLIPVDTDGDNKADFLDLDSDNDGYTDCEEGYENADCSNIVVGNNGMVYWVENSDIYWDTDHAVPNGKVSEPDPDNSGQLQDELKNTNHEAAYREFLCGKGLTQLTAYQWKLISLPCDTGSNSVQDVFRQLGTYGDDHNFVMYKQAGSDNYEVNASHKNTTKAMLQATETLKQGISYWIITDADHNVTIDKTLSGLSPTPTDPSAEVGISDPDFTEIYKHTLPNNIMTNGGDAKKYMAGNPFPYGFMVKNLYFSHGDSSGSYNPMGVSANDGYINAAFYKHDSNETGPVNGYEAISAGTPGFDTGGIKAMEGFFIKIEDNNSDANANYFAYPLVPKNGSGN